MLRLSQDEKNSLLEFVSQPPLEQMPVPVLSIEDYLKFLSEIPPSMAPPKPVRFEGDMWLL